MKRQIFSFLFIMCLFISALKIITYAESSQEAVDCLNGIIVDFEEADPDDEESFDIVVVETENDWLYLSAEDFGITPESHKIQFLGLPVEMYIDVTKEEFTQWAYDDKEATIVGFSFPEYTKVVNLGNSGNIKYVVNSTNDADSYLSLDDSIFTNAEYDISVYTFDYYGWTQSDIDLKTIFAYDSDEGYINGGNTYAQVLYRVVDNRKNTEKDYLEVLYTELSFGMYNVRELNGNKYTVIGSYNDTPVENQDFETSHFVEYLVDGSVRITSATKSISNKKGEASLSVVVEGVDIELGDFMFYTYNEIDNILYVAENCGKIQKGRLTSTDASNESVKINDKTYTFRHSNVFPSYSVYDEATIQSIISSSNPNLNNVEYIAIDDEIIYLVEHTTTYNGSCGNNLIWSLDITTGKLIISGIGDMNELYSSDSAPWYDYRNNIIEVVIEDGVTSLASYSFYDCDKVASISIPNSITNISKNAFERGNSLKNVFYIGDIVGWLKIKFEDPSSNPLCSGANLYINGNLLSEATIPQEITTIGAYAFYNCNSLTEISIPDNITTIEEYAFFNCQKLKSITIGNGITNIERRAFYGCFNLANIYHMGDISSWLGIKFSESTSTPMCYSGNLHFGEKLVTEVVVPNNITNIGDYAFYRCNSLTSITIPDSVTTIGSSAFYNCSNIENISIGNNVTSIGDYAFAGCDSLGSVEIPDNVTIIGQRAFGNCSTLAQITVGDGNSTFSSIDGVLFNKEQTELIYCPDKKQTYIVPNSVTSIASFAFDDCENLTSITISSNVRSIGTSAFDDCRNITTITIPDSVTSIGNSAFNNCINLTTIAISNNITDIGNMTFRGCKNLTSVTIPNNVTNIGDYAFSGCSKLKDVAIGDNVTNIGEYAFANCIHLTSITIPENVTHIGKSVFYGCNNIESITLPFVGESKKGHLDTYQYPFGYIFGTSFFDGSTATDQYYYGSSTNYTTDATYYIPNSLKTVTIMGGEILYGAFSNCNNLTNVIFLDNVTNIGACAFIACSNLKNITLSNKTISIGEDAFASCTSIICITIPSSVISIGDCAFIECSNLESITIPNSVTNIGDWAFDGCKNLIIYGFKNSYAETYTKENYLPFIRIPYVEKNMVIYENDFSDANTLKDFAQFCYEWAIRDGKLYYTGTKTVGDEYLGYMLYKGDINLENYIVEVDYMNVQTLGGVVFHSDFANADYTAHGYRGYNAFIANYADKGALGLSNSKGEYVGQLNVGKNTCNVGVNAHFKIVVNDANVNIEITNVDTGSIIYTYEYTLGNQYIDAGEYSNGAVGLIIRDKLYNLSSANTAYFDNFKITKIIKVASQGDADGDGIVNIKDVLVSLNAILNGTALEGTDMNGDGKLTLIDVIRVLKAITA